MKQKIRLFGFIALVSAALYVYTIFLSKGKHFFLGWTNAVT